ncbi:MAG: T9SS type A sorting domain-containing protein, partial [Bacteroidales bacterium]|nr:T9SS type A sorting domain-containing protein [Bacteroidales bacterium]
ISNIEGRINIWNQLVRFQPTANTEASTENTPVEPQLFTLADVGTGDQAKLVKFEDVFITGASGTFMNGQNYTITDNETEFVLRTDFYNADYIGQPIPGANTPLHVTGVILQHQASMQIVPRFADDIVEQEEVGVIDAGITAVSIYPNPASSTVYIRTDMEVYGIRLIDMLGQVVYSASTGGHQLHVDVSHLNKGIYFIQLISDKGLFTERIHIAR